MNTRVPVRVAVVTALLVLATGPASTAGPNNEPATHILGFGEHNNTGIAPNGDTVEMTCEAREGACGTFAVHPKALPDPPSGEFVHRDAAGNVMGAGTWTATKLLAFDSYGCGIVASEGVELPPNFCGGMLKLRVVLSTPIGDFEAIFTIFCIVGPNPPNSHDEPAEEGITLAIPGVINFNHAAGGENIYIRTA